MDELIGAYAAAILWAQGLVQVSDQRWLAPMRSGGWSVGETLAHLLAWDRFALTERLPRMRPGAALPSAPDVEAFNARTAAHARADVSRDALIAEFATVRSTLVAHLRALSAGSAAMTFTIAGQQQTVQDYVKEMLAHTREHQAEVDAFLVSAGEDQHLAP
jgi:uncharacterized damage-inducible protein DinB